MNGEEKIIQFPGQESLEHGNYQPSETTRALLDELVSELESLVADIEDTSLLAFLSGNK